MKQVAEEPESWEELEALRLGEEDGEDNQAQKEQEQSGYNHHGTDIQLTLPDGVSMEQKAEGGRLEGDKVDKAIQEALQNTRERQTVLRIDGEVEKFVRDPTRTVLEFGHDLTSYQVRVTDLMEKYKPPESANQKVMPEITIKRRLGAALGRAPPTSLANREHANQGVMSVKQREEEYKAARDRILGNSTDVHVESQNASDTTGGASRVPNAEDARNRKAVFKNKQVEMQDPDYKRGTNRYARSMFDPNYGYYEQQRSGIYNVPTYNSEFPALPGGHQAPPTGTAPPQYFPQNMGGWGMPPRSHPPTNGMQQNYQTMGPSSSMPPPVPYSMPPFPMSHMGYAYPPENLQQQAYHQPVASTGMQPYRGMTAPPWNAQGMGNYGAHSNPAQDSMGMVHPMHMYPHVYPPQGPGFPMDFDMSRPQYQMPTMNGYGGNAGQYRNTDTSNLGQQKPGENLVPKHENSTKPQPVEN